jgi:hypothetical protein
MNMPFLAMHLQCARTEAFYDGAYGEPWLSGAVSRIVYQISSPLLHARTPAALLASLMNDLGH